MRTCSHQRGVKPLPAPTHLLTGSSPVQANSPGGQGGSPCHTCFSISRICSRQAACFSSSFSWCFSRFSVIWVGVRGRESGQPRQAT